MLNLLLKNIAQNECFSVQSETPLKNVIETMNINGKGVVVVLKEGNPAGILTERDMVEILYKGLSLEDTADTHARKNLIITNGTRTIGHALNLTIENNIRRVIVTDDDGKFIGIVTQQDLLRYLEEDYYRSTLKVKHILEKLRYLISVSAQDCLKEVLKRIVENRISAVTVMEGDNVVGIITERDILQLATRQTSLDEKVCNYMSHPVISADSETALVDIVRRMNEKNIRRVVITNDTGEAINIVTIRDVVRNLEGDYSKFLERKLKSAKDILHLLPEMLIEVTDTGTEQLIIWANEKALNRFGREVLDTPVSEFIPDGNWDSIYRPLMESRKVESIKIKKDEDIYELSGVFIKTYGEIEKGRFQLILKDITEDVKLSITDPLTGIYNRRFINEFLMREIERCRRHNKQFSAVICDLDKFKVINDTYGHLSGDVVLKGVAAVIAENVRKQDIVGRYGGDEFVVIMPETTDGSVYAVLERLEDRLSSLEIKIPSGITVKIDASLGVATFPLDGVSSDDLLVRADQRLYECKRGKKTGACDAQT